MYIGKVIPVLLLVLSSLFLAGCPGPDPDPPSTVITELTGGDHGSESPWGRWAINILYDAAQGFQAPANDSCASVELLLGAFNGSPTGDYTVRLETDTGGLPSGTPVSVNAEASMAAVSLHPSAWNSWQFDVPVPLAAGQTYWIVCRSTEAAGTTNRVTIVGDTTESYAGGTAAMDTGGGWIVAAVDHNFRILR